MNIWTSPTFGDFLEAWWGRWNNLEANYGKLIINNFLKLRYYRGRFPVLQHCGVVYSFWATFICSVIWHLVGLCACFGLSFITPSTAFWYICAIMVDLTNQNTPFIFGVYIYNHRGVTICDVIKQNKLELANTNYKIKPNKADSFFVSYCFCKPINFLYFWNQLPNLRGGFTNIKLT